MENEIRLSLDDYKLTVWITRIIPRTRLLVFISFSLGTTNRYHLGHAYHPALITGALLSFGMWNDEPRCEIKSIEKLDKFVKKSLRQGIYKIYSLSLHCWSQIDGTIILSHVLPLSDLAGTECFVPNIRHEVILDWWTNSTCTDPRLFEISPASMRTSEWSQIKLPLSQNRKKIFHRMQSLFTFLDRKQLWSMQINAI